MDTTKLRQIVIWLVMWLTRTAGVIFVLVGLGFFVTAWNAWAIPPVLMGVITIAIGVVMISIRVVPGQRMQYGLFRPRRRSP